MNETKPTLRPVFISYRRKGRDLPDVAAQTVYELLNRAEIPGGTDALPDLIDPYWDQAARSIEDWRTDQLGHLKRSLALIVIGSPGLTTDFRKQTPRKEDQVHEEIDWWIENRKVAPIYVDTALQERWVPESIKTKWPKLNKIQFSEKKFDMGSPTELAYLRTRIIKSIADSAPSIYADQLAELQSAKRRAVRWAWASAVGLLVAIGFGVSYYEESKELTNNIEMLDRALAENLRLTGDISKKESEIAEKILEVDGLDSNISSLNESVSLIKGEKATVLGDLKQAKSDVARYSKIAEDAKKEGEQQRAIVAAQSSFAESRAQNVESAVKLALTGFDVSDDGEVVVLTPDARVALNLALQTRGLDLHTNGESEIGREPNRWRFAVYPRAKILADRRESDLVQDSRIKPDGAGLFLRDRTGPRIFSVVEEKSEYFARPIFDLRWPVSKMIDDAQFSADGSTLVIVGEAGVAAFDTSNGGQVYTAPLDRRIYEVSINLDGSRVFLGGENGFLAMAGRDVKDVQSLDFFESDIEGLSANAVGDRLAVLSSGSYVLDTATDKIAKVDGCSYGIEASTAISPDGLVAAFAVNDTSNKHLVCIVQDVNQFLHGSANFTEIEMDRRTKDIALSDDGELLLVQSHQIVTSNTEIRRDVDIYNVSDGTLAAAMPFSRNPIKHARFSNDGRHVVFIDSEFNLGAWQFTPFESDSELVKRAIQLTWIDLDQKIRRKFEDFFQ